MHPCANIIAACNRPIIVSAADRDCAQAAALSAGTRPTSLREVIVGSAADRGAEGAL